MVKLHPFDTTYNRAKIFNVNEMVVSCVPINMLVYKGELALTGYRRFYVMLTLVLSNTGNTVKTPGLTIAMELKSLEHGNKSLCSEQSMLGD
jgi:hypothetical protein